MTHRYTNLHAFSGEVSEARFSPDFIGFSTIVGKEIGWKIGAYTVQTCLTNLAGGKG